MSELLDAIEEMIRPTQIKMIHEDDRLRRTIFRAPFHMKNIRESDFEPKFVAIGPYFHGLQNLRNMEERKPQFAVDLVHKLAMEETNIIDDLVDNFKPIVSHIWSRYNGPGDFTNINSLGEDEFLKMLALDSCFIIRLIIAVYKMRDTMDLLGFDIKEIRSDLLLLENQIPLFILRRAYDFISTRRTSQLPPFQKVLLRFIRLDMTWLPKENDMHLFTDHLLDLYWRCFLPPDEFQFELEARFLSGFNSFNYVGSETGASQAPQNANMHPQTATELHKTAGIVFKRRKYADGFGASFRNGTMKMPCLKIDPNEQKILLNLIAYEHFMCNKYRICMSYMILVDALINTEDVVLLQKQGILINKLRSNAVAAVFFKNIGILCSVEQTENYFTSLTEEVNNYYASTSNRRLASLRHNYCNSNVISSSE